jgi:hypothetical protein
MSSDYSYVERSRRPVTIAAAALCLAMFCVGIAYQAPWYFLAPIILSGAMTFVMIVTNRQSGMNLAGNILHVYSGKWNEQILVDDIAQMQLTRWTDGAPSVVMVLKNSVRMSIPGQCFGSAKDLSEALASRGVLIRSN